jgi:hypothetical protein
MIKMSAKVNETVDDKTLLRVYKEEIEQLRVRLQELEQQNIRSAAIASALPSSNGIGTLVRSDSASTINNGEISRGGASETEEEDANLMLQMITEMERLILRADVSRNFAIPGIARKGSAPQLLTSEGGSATKRSAEKSVRPNTSTPGSDTTRSPRSEKRRAKEDRPRGTGSADAADAAFAGRGLVPRHLQSKVKEKKDLPAKNRNKNVFASSNIALLSMIVEATDSDNLVRIDTVEESENEYENEHASGTEPEEDSDISESELATSARPAVLEDIIAASNLTDALMSASQDPAMDMQNVYHNTAADEVRPAPPTRVHSDFFMPAPAEDAVPAASKVEVSTEERAAFISADTTPGAPVVPRAGMSGEKASPPGTLPAKSAMVKQTAGKQTSIKTPPPRIPKVPSMSIAKSSPGTSGIPRGASFRSRSITQRAMSMDSEAGGDECSLASHKLDSSWDEFDPRDSEIDKGGKFSSEEIAASAPAAVPATYTEADAMTGPAILHSNPEVPDLAKAADAGFPPMTGGMLAARSGGLCLPIAEAEDDSVLLGVSKMLMVLRGHVSKTRSKYVAAVSQNI